MFRRVMISASLISWILIALMPVINAHAQAAGVWATLCTANGFERVFVRERVTVDFATTSLSDVNGHYKGPSCPASHFSYQHDFAIQASLRLVQVQLISIELYHAVLQPPHHTLRFPRAPPALSF